MQDESEDQQAHDPERDRLELLDGHELHDGEGDLEDAPRDQPDPSVVGAAQERDETLFRAAFAPTVDTAKLNEESFRKFRKKVLGNQITPVPESVQMVGDNDAIVKLRNARGREIPVKVTKVDGKWLVAEIGFGEKVKTRNKEGNPKAAPAAPGKPT